MLCFQHEHYNFVVKIPNKDCIFKIVQCSGRLWKVAAQESEAAF